MWWSTRLGSKTATSFSVIYRYMTIRCLSPSTCSFSRVFWWSRRISFYLSLSISSRTIAITSFIPVTKVSPPPFRRFLIEEVADIVIDAWPSDSKELAVFKSFCSSNWSLMSKLSLLVSVFSMLLMHCLSLDISSFCSRMVSWNCWNCNLCLASTNLLCFLSASLYL